MINDPQYDGYCDPWTIAPYASQVPHQCGITEDVIIANSERVRGFCDQGTTLNVGDDDYLFYTPLENVNEYRCIEHIEYHTSSDTD